MMKVLNRRDALKLGTAAGGGLIGLLLSIPAIGLLLSPLFARTRTSWTTVGPIDHVPIGVPTAFVVAMPTGEGWKTPPQDRVVYVVRPDHERLLALANICTHMQCPVHWDTTLGRFLCPCHGGLYDQEGRNVGGPPPQPLPQWVHRTHRDASGATILEVSNQLTFSI